MSGKNLKAIGVLLVSGSALFLHASLALGFGVFDEVLPNNITFADLLANPNQYASWDPDSPGGSVITITYMFDSTFTTDERLRNQVRLAFRQWDRVNGTPYGATYSYLRNNGIQDFYDLWETAVHELGHNLGFAHPFDVAPLGLNYDLVPPNTLVPVPQRDDEVMSYGLAANAGPGSYNRTLSHDEINGFRYCYANKNINFVEVTSGVGEIMISAEPMGGAILGYGPPTAQPRDPNDPTLGNEIVSAQIIFGSDAIVPLGFRTLGLNWDVENTSGKSSRGVEIRTRGTSNPNPIKNFDGDPAGFRFDSYSVASAGDPDHKEDLLHTWTDASYWGSSVEIPPGSLHHVGIEQDVWDWTAVSASTLNTDGTRAFVPLVSFSQWNETVVGIEEPPDPGTITIPDTLPEIIAEGIRVTNTEDAPCQLDEIGVAVVDGRGLQLEDLNRGTLEQLIDEGLLETFDDLVPRMLDYGEELFLVLGGDPLETTNTVSLNRPDLLDHELFIYAETTTAEATVGSYGLLGTPPITIPMPVPEPSTLILAAIGLLAAGWAWRRRRQHA